jgi:integrase
MKKSTDIRTLKALNKPQRYSISDTRGLHLWVRPDLLKFWIFRFTFNGVRKDASLGSFPAVTLVEARTKALKMKGMVLNGTNPIEVKKKLTQQSALNSAPKVTFKKYALDYIKTFSPQWTNPKHASQWINTMTTYAFPVIGSMSMEDVTTNHIIQILSPIWSSKHETASRVRGRISKILSASITSGHRTKANPALWAGHLEHLLPNIRKSQRHHPALPYADLPALMKELALNECISSLALQFTILNAVRTGEAIYAKRTEISNDVWSIPAERMKSRRPHQVPLCSRSLELIKKAASMDPESEFIFSNNKECLSSMAMLMLLRGYRAGMTVHGFRSSMRDFIAEETTHSPEVAEMTLAHTIANRVEAAYRRGNLMDRRRALLEDWQDFCLGTASQTDEQRQ